MSEVAAIGVVVGIVVVVLGVWVVVMDWLDRRRDARDEHEREVAWRYGGDR